MSLIEQLNQYAAMSEAEMRSRAGALKEVKALLSGAAAALAEGPRNEMTSPEVAALAARVLSGDHKPSEEEARALAASCLTQAPDHELIPRNKIIEASDLPPEAQRALEDAIRNRQALPLISRQEGS